MPDSVYTNTKKADVITDSTVKSVQSKQMILDSFDSFMELMKQVGFTIVSSEWITKSIFTVVGLKE